MTRTERIRRETIAIADYVNETASRMEKFASLRVKRTNRGFSVRQLTQREIEKNEAKEKATKATGGNAEKK